MNEREIIDILNEMALKKETALKELHELTITQKNLIHQRDMVQLNDILEKRQEIMEVINELDVEFLSAYKTLKRKLNVQTLEEIDTKKYSSIASLMELKQTINNIMNLLEKIDAIDKLNQENFQAGLDELKKDMKKITIQKQSTRAAFSYGQKYVGAEGIFIDNKLKK